MISFCSGSRNLALGILDKDAFTAEFETLELNADDYLYAFSDGVTDVEDSTGRLFTRDRLEKVLSAVTDAERIPAIMAKATAFRGLTPLRDDLTILEIHSGSLAKSLAQRSKNNHEATLLAAG